MLAMKKLINRFNELITLNNYNQDKKGIGELSEKTLHHIIKNLYESNILNQEIKIDNYYVDILKDNNIIEIQTKQFNKLRNKLEYFLSLNKYTINIIYPIFTEKMIYLLDKDNKIIKSFKSPKKLHIPEIFYELYKIKPFLNNNKLSITLLLLKIDEYRIITNNRKGYICYERIPKKLIDEIILNNNKDYLSLLPKDLKEEFTSKDLSLLTKTDIKYVNKMLNVLKYLNALEVIGKDGKKYIYRIKKG